MHFHLVSLFPEFFDTPLSCGLLGKAVDKEIVAFSHVNPRDFTTDNHRTVDDRPYGGGPGMVMLLDPLMQALETIEKPGRILVMSPRGRRFDQAMARELARDESVTIVCGRYEGFDDRLFELTGAEEVSMGDFVLNGGEAAAVCVVEAVSRLQPGYMGHASSGHEESFSAGLVEYPHYTRPEVFRGVSVPEMLMSGDHARIAAWRREQAVATTLAKRPELLSEAVLTHNDTKLLRHTPRHRPGRNLYLALVHHPVMNKAGETVAVSVTNLDIHDIARAARSYGLGGYYVTTPLEDQRRLVDELLEHWTRGAGAKAIPDRAKALSLVRPVDGVAEAVADIEERTGQTPRIVATSARGPGSLRANQVRGMLDDTPVLLLFGTGSGLAHEVLDMAEGTLRPIRFMDSYNHLSVRSAVSITVDRLLADAW